MSDENEDILLGGEDIEDDDYQLGADDEEALLADDDDLSEKRRTRSDYHHYSEGNDEDLFQEAEEPDDVLDLGLDDLEEEIQDGSYEHCGDERRSRISRGNITRQSPSVQEDYNDHIPSHEEDLLQNKQEDALQESAYETEQSQEESVVEEEEEEEHQSEQRDRFRAERTNTVSLKAGSARQNYGHIPDTLDQVVTPQENVRGNKFQSQRGQRGQRGRSGPKDSGRGASVRGRLGPPNHMDGPPRGGGMMRHGPMMRGRMRGMRGQMHFRPPMGPMGPGPMGPGPMGPGPMGPVSIMGPPHMGPRGMPMGPGPMMRGPGPGPNGRPNRGMGPRMGPGPNQIIGPGLNMGPRPNMSSGPNMGPGQNISPGQNMGPGQHMGPGPNMGSGPNMSSGPNMGSGSNMGPGPDMGCGPGMGPRPIHGRGAGPSGPPPSGSPGSTVRLRGTPYNRPLQMQPQQQSIPRHGPPPHQHPMISQPPPHQPQSLQPPHQQPPHQQPPHQQPPRQQPPRQQPPRQQPPRQQLPHQQSEHQQSEHQQPLHQQPLHQQPLHQQPLHQQPPHQQPPRQQPPHQQPPAIHVQQPHVQQPPNLSLHQSLHQQLHQPPHQQPVLHIHQPPVHQPPPHHQPPLTPPHQVHVHQIPQHQTPPSHMDQPPPRTIINTPGGHQIIRILPEEQRPKIHINPHFRGTVQSNQDGRLIWDRPNENQNQGPPQHQFMEQGPPIGPFTVYQETNYPPPRSEASFNWEGTHPPHDQDNTNISHTPSDAYYENSPYIPQVEEGGFPHEGPNSSQFSSFHFQSGGPQHEQPLPNTSLPPNIGGAAPAMFSNFNYDAPQEQPVPFGAPRFSQPPVSSPQQHHFPAGNRGDMRGPVEPMQGTSVSSPHGSAPPSGHFKGSPHFRPPPKRQISDGSSPNVVPVKQARFDKRKKNNRVQPSNLHEVQTVDTLPDTTSVLENVINDTQGEFEDEETREYRKKIEEQKKLREKIIREKEERRKRAAMEKQQRESGPGDSSEAPADPTSQFQISTIVNRQEEVSPTQMPQQKRQHLQAAHVQGQVQKQGTAQSRTQQSAPPGQRVLLNVAPMRGVAAVRRGRDRGRGGSVPAAPQRQVHQNQSAGGLSKVTVKPMKPAQQPIKKEGAVPRRVVVQSSAQNSLSSQDGNRIVLRPSATVAPTRVVIMNQQGTNAPGDSASNQKPNNADSTSLKSVVIECLSNSTSEKQLRLMCITHGKVECIRLDPQNKKAFVRFAEHKAASNFVNHYQRRPMVDLSFIKVSLVKDSV